MEEVKVYDPRGLPGDQLLGYVNEMRAELLSPELTPELFRGRSGPIQTALDTSNQAYLMMALAGMEYYDVTPDDDGELALDETLRNVVETGSPSGDGAPTGLTHVAAIKKDRLGFRADMVRVDGRPHFVLAVRGTQVKQPSFIQSLGNVIADLSAVGIDFEKALRIEADFGGLGGPADLAQFRDQLLRDVDRLDSEMFSKSFPVVHAGFFISSSIIYGGEDGLEQAIVEAIAESRELPVDDPDHIPAGEKACVWVTGHSLGGAMAPILGYRLTRDPTFHQQAAICGIYTFGAPRVGNGAFAGEYNGRDIAYGSRAKLGDVTFRYQLGDDIVPHVPPNIPRFFGRGRGLMAELVAEVLMRIAFTYAPEIEAFEQIAPQIDAALTEENFAELERLTGSIDPGLASLLAGPGQTLLQTYDIMIEADKRTGGDGTLRLSGEGYQIAKQFIAFGNEEDHFDLRNVFNDFPGISVFKGLQHIGHTRWLSYQGPDEFELQTGQPGSEMQAHHVRWMMSIVDELRRAACIDERNGDDSSAAMKTQVRNSLTFHRTPFYASVLLGHTAAGGSAFYYPEGDEGFHEDRLERGVDFSSVEGFEDAIADRYDEDGRTFFECD